MSLVINLLKRCVEIEDSGTKLLFEHDDSFFHLRVIALVAQKMKDRAKTQNGREYISISDLEDEAWLFNNEKIRGYKSKGSMRTNIYQTWRDRLNPTHDKCVYEIKWAEGKTHTRQNLVDIKKYFKTEIGKGPTRAAYKIEIDPSKIKIIFDLALSNLINKSKKEAPLSSLSNKEKVKCLIKNLEEATNPRSYNKIIFESTKAITLLLNQQEICKPDKKGKLPLLLHEYAEIYSKHIGYKGVHGIVLVDMWFNALKKETWWEKFINTCDKERPLSSSRIPIEPDPKEMAEFCLLFGDIISLMWLFHWGYLANMIAAKRHYLISSIRNQNGDVRTDVYREWAKMIGKDVNYLDIAQNPVEAFRYMQFRKGIFLSFR